MKNDDDSRREFLRRSAATAAAIGLVACGTDPEASGGPPIGSGLTPQSRPPDPGGPRGPAVHKPEVCGPTDSDIEGPFYRADAPWRVKIAADAEPGTRLVVIGTVFGRDCRTPLAGAVVDVWQADDGGVYDGGSPEFRMRGQVTTDADGNYEVDTVLPGHYSGRPRHIHYKVRYTTGPADSVELTTQLYFAGDSLIDSDPWATHERAIGLTDDAGTMRGRFDIVLDA